MEKYASQPESYKQTKICWQAHIQLQLQVEGWDNFIPDFSNHPPTQPTTHRPKK